MKQSVSFFLMWLVYALPALAQLPPVPNTDRLELYVEQAQTRYQTLSARAKVTWSDGTEETSFQTTIRMRKDSVVWMSLSSSGIEGARLLIRPDSMQVMNNLSGDLSTHDLSYLQFWLPFPVNFTQLQQFIAGQRMTIGPKVSLVTEEDSLLALRTESDQMRETVWVDRRHYTIRKILLKDKLLNQDMEIIFDSYAALNGVPFAYRRDITIHHGPALLTMTIEVTRAKLNEDLSYPFEK